MKIQTWTFGICVSLAVALHTPATLAQQQNVPPSSLPSLNAIDPAALNAPPAFGDSGPVPKPPHVRATESTEAAGTRWIPKLRVVLVTAMSEQTEVLVHTFGTNGSPARYFSNGLEPVVQKTTRTINMPSQSSVILNCDDVNVEAVSSTNDKLTYSFSCKGKAVLSIDGYTVSGDSISASEGTLTITNAVIKSDQATMTSEKMVLQMPILAVQVGAASAADFLKPTPDPVGANGELKNRDRFEPDNPYDRSSAPADAKPNGNPTENVFPDDLSF